MARFEYQGFSKEGRTRGTLDADDLDTAVDELNARGITPIAVDEIAGGGGFDLNALTAGLFEKKITTDELVMFVRQLYSLLNAGVPLVRSLRGLADNTRNERLAGEIRNIAGRLEQGSTFSDAMAQSPKVFPKLLTAMVRVGEASGRLEESLDRMAANLEQERDTRAQVKQALRYPTFVMIAIALAIVVVNLFVIPAFADMFEQFDTELPLPTRMLIGFSDFMQNNGLYLLVGLIVAAGVVRYLINTETGRWRWDRYKLRLPLIGSIMTRALLGRFSRTLAMSLRSGVPVLQALNAVAETTDNAYVSGGVRQMREGIEQGESLYAVAEHSGLFTALVLQMLAVGEETGQVSDMMDQVASYYEREVAADLDKLSSYIEPIVIGFIGVLVLILALGIFLPMWQMGQAAM